MAAGVGAYWMYGDQLPRSLSGDLARAKKDVVAASRQVTDRIAAADSARRAQRAAEERALTWAPLEESSIDSSAAPPSRTQPSRTQPSRTPKRPETQNRNPLESLGRTSGPAFVTVTAREAAVIFAPAIRRALPRNATDLALAFSDDRIQLRGVVDLRDYTGDGAIGTLLGGALGGREPLRIAGSLAAPRPGVAALRVTDLSLKGISIPSPLIPRLLRTLRARAGRATDGDVMTASDENVLEFSLPKQVADLRVFNGRLTLYRAQ